LIPSQEALGDRLRRLAIAADELRALVSAVKLDGDDRTRVSIALDRVELAIVMVAHAARVPK
jgi:hypothetical protein